MIIYRCPLRRGDPAQRCCAPSRLSIRISLAHAPFGYRIVRRSLSPRWVSSVELPDPCSPTHCPAPPRQCALQSPWSPAIWSIWNWTYSRGGGNVPLAYSCAIASLTTWAHALPPCHVIPVKWCGLTNTTRTWPTYQDWRFCWSATSAAICGWCWTMLYRMWWRHVAPIAVVRVAGPNWTPNHQWSQLCGRCNQRRRWTSPNQQWMSRVYGSGPPPSSRWMRVSGRGRVVVVKRVVVAEAPAVVAVGKREESESERVLGERREGEGAGLAWFIFCRTRFCYWLCIAEITEFSRRPNWFPQKRSRRSGRAHAHATTHTHTHENSLTFLLIS